MSSGASAAYENPRSGRSSCIDETPRSSRIASARTPFPAGPEGTLRRLPWGSPTFAAVPRRSRSKYGATVGSRSIAISLPSPRSRAVSKEAWPPAPNVQSMIVSPGFGARAASTSSARTGTWSVSVGNALGNMSSAPFDLSEMLVPLRPVPDLEVVMDAGDGDLALDPGGREQGRRQHQPALLVELGGHGLREEVPPHHARLPAERVEVANPRGHPVPVVLGVGLEAPVEPDRDDDAIPEQL